MSYGPAIVLNQTEIFIPYPKNVLDAKSKVKPILIQCFDIR